MFMKGRHECLHGDCRYVAPLALVPMLQTLRSATGQMREATTRHVRFTLQAAIGAASLRAMCGRLRAVMCGRLRAVKGFWLVLQRWSVQPCVRPLCGSDGRWP